MSKKKWLLLIIVLIGFSYLIVSKVFPAIGTNIDNIVGPSVAGGVTGIVKMVTDSPTWQTWGNYISFGVGGAIIGVLLWQGHNAYNKVRAAASRSAVKEAYGYQVGPTAQPAVIPQPPSTPTVAPQPVIPPQEEKPA